MRQHLLINWSGQWPQNASKACNRGKEATYVPKEMQVSPLISILSSYWILLSVSFSSLSQVESHNCTISHKIPYQTNWRTCSMILIHLLFFSLFAFINGSWWWVNDPSVLRFFPRFSAKLNHFSPRFSDKKCVNWGIHVNGMVIDFFSFLPYLFWSLFLLLYLPLKTWSKQSV